MQNPDSEPTKQPSSDELLDAADIMADMADGHCSIGSVPKDVAERRRRVAGWLRSMSETTTNVVSLGTSDGRREAWTLPDGTVVTISVPASEPPITIKHGVYCLSAILHQIHKAVFS